MGNMGRGRNPGRGRIWREVVRPASFRLEEPGPRNNASSSAPWPGGDCVKQREPWGHGTEVTWLQTFDTPEHYSA